MLLSAIALVSPAHAYLTLMPPSTEQLTAMSDITVKATALDSAPVADAGKYSDQGVSRAQTRFRVVSVLRGNVQVGQEIDFRHYAGGQNARFGMVYAPYFLNFSPGQSYLLWARAAGGIWEQPWTDPVHFDLGALPTLDNSPVAGPIKEALWAEMTASLRRGNSAEQMRAISNLLARTRPLAGSSYGSHSDFAAQDALDAIAPLLQAPDEKVVLAAVNGFGFVGVRDPAPLLAIARSPSPRVRRSVLKALKGVATPEVETRARAAVIDSDADVVAAALRLLADFPGRATRATWKRAARSGNATLRVAVANAIGSALDTAMLPTLRALTRDSDKQVSYAASSALSLYQYPTLGF